MPYDLITVLFGGDRPSLTLRPEQVALRAMVMYLAALMLVRLGKSRLLSRAAPIDGILTILLGAIVGGAIMGTSPMSLAIIAVATLITVHWCCTALAFWSKTCGKLFKGNPYVLIVDGVINGENMRRAHISEDDLLEELRLNANIADVSQVKLAVKERSGSVGVVKKSGAAYRIADVSIEAGVQTVRITIN